MSKWACFFFLFAVCTHISTGQGPNEGFVMESEATRHLITHIDPIYPAIAKAARIQGDVLLHAEVDARGNVTSIEVVGGPLMLKDSAVKAVKQWKYRPFEVDGKPSIVRIIVEVAFSLGIPPAFEKSDIAIGQAYFPKSTECRAANAAGHWADAVKSCGELIAIAERFPDPVQRTNEIRLAHQEYGEALAFSGELLKALTEFHRTAELAEKSLTPTDAEFGTAYYWLAFAEHASKMPVEAERDYVRAEESYRKAMVNLPDMKKVYERYLAHTLAYHSVLASQTGRDEAAKALQGEALALDPRSLDALKGSNQ